MSIQSSTADFSTGIKEDSDEEEDKDFENFQNSRQSTSDIRASGMAVYKK